MTEFIGIISGKGGAGKTTVAINLTTALTYAGRDVVLVDANLSTPNVSLYLGAPQVQTTLHDALLGKVDIKNTSYLHPSGIRAIPASLVSKDSTLMLMQRFADTLTGLDGTAEAIVIDAAAGLGDDMTELFKSLDRAIIVTNPELPAVTDALKTIRAAEEVGCPIVGVVLNKVRKKPFEMKAEEVEAFLGKPLIGLIPHDNSVSEAVALRHPVVYSHPNSAATEGFKELAANLVR